MRVHTSHFHPLPRLPNALKQSHCVRRRGSNVELLWLEIFDSVVTDNI
jgi:hypothetical protein